MKLRKSLFILVVFILSLFLVSCDINVDSPDVDCILNYTSNGNGSIVCVYESGTKFDSSTYVCIYSSPNEEEEFLGWEIDDKSISKNESIVVLVDKEINVVANFTSNTDKETVVYDANTLYANLPSDWENVKVNIQKYMYSSITDYDMTKDENGIWSLNLSNYNITKSSISSVYFYSGNKKTETYFLDTDYNFFNYAGKNYKGELTGGFDIKKCDNVFKLSILELNDLHGYIVQSDEGKDGISNVSYLIEKVRSESEEDNTVLVANGDMFQGSGLSNLTNGLSVINVMNEMKFDFMGVGNHEFDWGLEKIRLFFDGDLNNGEANFPLVNSNISKIGTKNLITDNNILSTYLFEKNGIKIGVVSMIDDLKSSILYSKTKDYDFLGTQLVREQAVSLKNNGADIIIANIHGGDSDDASNFSMNKILSKLEYNGDWLIDCVINGHTHTNQIGTIKRAGQDLQIVQAGSYAYYLGQIDLYIDLDTKNLTTSKAFTTNTYEAGINYTKSVQDIVDSEYDKVKDKLEETYCIASTTVKNRSDYYTWSANVMLTAADTICGISNTGGIRSTGNLKMGKEIGLENVYLINPFDNEIMIVEITGKQLYKFLKNRSVYYSLKDGYTLSSLQNDSKKYKVAVIDYVYYWDTFPHGSNDYNSGLIFRDIMIEDLKLRNTFNPATDTTPMIGKLIK